MFVDKAIAFRKEKKFEDAKRFYEKAIKTLSTLHVADENKYNKETYVKKTQEYKAIIAEIDNEIKEYKKEQNKKQETEQDAKGKESGSGCLVSETPDVKWEDVAGLEKAKEAGKEAVILPLKCPHLFVGQRKPWKGILLYGPPGTGKSYLAKAAATETGGKFYSVSAANIVSKWMGESERGIKALFDLARQNRPAVIFLDEIDSVMSARGEGDNDASRRLKTEFLIQMQGVGKDDDGIGVLGATNTPWGLDPAVRRRFQKKIYIGLPEEAARRHMFIGNLGDTENEISKSEFDILAQMTNGYSGSDIATLTQDAIYEPLRKCQSARFFKKIDDYSITPCPPSAPGAMKMTLNDITDPKSLVPPKVLFEDYIKAIGKIKATVNPADLKRQEDFTKEFGQEG